METLIVITSIIAVTSIIICIKCLTEIKRLREQINLLDKENHNQNKELITCKKVLTLLGHSVNDLAEIVTSKTFNAFPLIGQSGNA